MSEFLERINLLIDLARYDGYDEDGEEINNLYEISKLRMEFSSLGENARKMLKIGIVQDELVKLEFKHHDYRDKPGHCDIPSNVTTMTTTTVVKGTKRTTRRICVTCWERYAILFREYGIKKQTSTKTFYFSSPTWQEDLINRVKELIND